MNLEKNITKSADRNKSTGKPAVRKTPNFKAQQRKNMDTDISPVKYKNKKKS